MNYHTHTQLGRAVLCSLRHRRRTTHKDWGPVCGHASVSSYAGACAVGAVLITGFLKISLEICLFDRLKKLGFVADEFWLQILSFAYVLKMGCMLRSDVIFSAGVLAWKT
jgi:hypothetical protein